MLITVDAGNTNITLGVFKEKKVYATFRMTTQMARTSDEYGVLIAEMLGRKGISPKDIEAVIISSVVPKIMYSLTNGIYKYIGLHPIVIEAGTKTGIKIQRANPREVGTDRIVDAVGAYELYGGPCIVIDFGTATTYDLITKDGTFAAGVTSPGIRICAKALWNDTAKLPEIEIKKPAYDHKEAIEFTLEQFTNPEYKVIDSLDEIEAIGHRVVQAGIVYGYIGQTEYIIDNMKKESGLLNAKVIATGGLGRIIYENTDRIDIYDKELTLQGMRLIYEKNKK